MSEALSDHYRGERGEDYFKYQNRMGALSGKLNARKFSQHIKPSDHVLDFGCGGGWLLKSLDCAQRVGIEPNLSAHDQCRSNNIEVTTSISEVTGLFSIVLSHHVLEHVPCPIDTLAELRTKLRPDGKLLLVLPADDWRVQRDYVGDINNHLHTWTPRLLGNTLREAGYTPSEIYILSHAWPPGLRQLDRFLSRPLFDAVCTLYSVLKRRRQLFAVASVKA